jgi:hypothetical protein
MTRTVRSILILAMGLTVLAPAAAHGAESRPEVSVSNVRVVEPGSGTGRARFYVRLDEAAAVPMHVRFATANGSALGGSDYNARRGRLTFRPGDVRRFVDVRVRADTPDERRETFTLRMSAATDRPPASRPRIADGTGRATIIDRDPAPTISIYGVNGSEGSDSLRFRVRLSRTTYRAVSASFATKAGTAAAEDDYVTRRGRVSIPSGEREGFIDVRPRNDTADEPDERFSIDLTGPSGGRLSKSSAAGTIVDDDPPRAITIADVTVAETSGVAQLEVSVPTTGPPVTVSYATHSGTARQDVDFTQTAGSVTIPANATSAKIEVPITVDFLDEQDEIFTVRLAQPVGATIADAQATVTIVDNDRPSVANVVGASGNEGNAGTTLLYPTILLSKDSALPITVTYQSVDGTATVANGDYTAVSGTVTFQPGETSKAIPIPVRGDLVAEPNEQLQLQITQATNATIGAASGNVVIINDDA